MDQLGTGTLTTTLNACGSFPLQPREQPIQADPGKWLLSV